MDLAKRWTRLAQDLRRSMLARFWLPSENFFSMAIDRNSKGEPRMLRTHSSNVAELLETTIFDDMTAKDRRRYVCSIVNEMFGDDFLTDAGIRTLARRHSDVLPYWDYQGSFTTWPTVSDSFARGLRHQGLEEQAIDIENRILNAINLTGDLVEFLFVDTDGRVDYDPFAKRTLRCSPIIVPAIAVPSRNQAWTISAVLRVLLTRAMSSPDGGPPDLNVLDPLPEMSYKTIPRGPDLIRTQTDARDAYPRHYQFRIDTDEGRARLRSHWKRRNVRLYAHDDPMNPD
jgi:glycogen debranching enzyme